MHFIIFPSTIFQLNENAVLRNLSISCSRNQLPLSLIFLIAYTGPQEFPSQTFRIRRGK